MYVASQLPDLSASYSKQLPSPGAVKRAGSIYTAQGKHSGPPFHGVTASQGPEEEEAPIQDTQQGTGTSTFA